MKSKHLLFFLTSFFFFSSCTIGPRMLSYTPIAYNKSIQQIQNEQMLMNLVRTRYFEQPFFLQLSSVSTSYSYGGAMGGSVTIPKEETPALGIVPTVTGTLNGAYSELPTFTFSPLQGRQYFEYLLKNIDIPQLVLLENWPFDFIMNTLVEEFANTYNDPNLSNTTYEDFLALADNLNRLRNRRNLHLFYQESGEKMPRGGLLMMLSYRSREEAKVIDTLLGVSKKISDQDDASLTRLCRIVPANDLISAVPDEGGPPIVSLRLFSFLEVLSVLGQGVEVPRKHLEKGVVLGDGAYANRPPDFPTIRVHHSTKKPENASVAVAYRGHWFYIDDSDIISKQMLIFLNVIFSLQSQSVVGQQPALTIPVR